MNEVAFLQQREADWTRLRLLCDKADVSPTQLSPAELQEFVRLYRAASKDLSTVRTRSSNLELADFLNDLVGRAYGVLYRPQPRRAGEAIRDAMVAIANSGRALKAYTLAAALLFALGGVFSFTVLTTAPEHRSLFIPRDWEENFDAWKQGRFEERTGEEQAMMTGFYSSNNPRAAISTASVSLATFGVGSAYLLFMNGELIGALAAELNSVGKLSHLATVLPHGVTEISGLILAGAAGLRFGWALIAPGRRRRGDSLREAGRDAVVAIAGSVLMMFMAAPIEGFVSFNPRVPIAIKLLIAAVTAMAWVLFWVGYGRRSEQGDHQEQREQVVNAV